jgi:hypothetical protein
MEDAGRKPLTKADEAVVGDNETSFHYLIAKNTKDAKEENWRGSAFGTCGAGGFVV